MKFGSIRAYVRELVAPLTLLAATLAIIFNVAFVHSSILGVTASCIYIVFLGFFFGRTFLGDEHEVFSRFMFAVFLVLSLLILAGTPVVVVYELNVLTLAVVLLVPLVVLAVSLRFKGLKSAKSRSATKKVDDAPYFSPAYIFPFIMMAFAEFLIITARSGWIKGIIWDVVSPYFFIAYFLAAISLFGVILYSRTKTVSKMLLTTMFSLLSITISAVVLYPGDVGDPLGQMGGSQLMLDYGTLREPYGLSIDKLPVGLWNIYWLLKRKALTLLTAMAAKMFVVDIYWVHTFIIPALWGIFVPLVGYKIVRLIGGEERVSVLGAFLPTFFISFLIWGSISTGNSLGFVFFFVSLYFAIRYLKSSKKLIPFLLAIVAATVTGLAHPFCGELAFSFLLLAFALNRYRVSKVKSPRSAYIQIVLLFLACLLILPVVFQMQNVVYLHFASPAVRENYAKEVIAFSPEKLLKTDMWDLVFGEYVNFSFKNMFLRAILPLLGFLGLVYTLSKRDAYERVLALFIFLGFVILQIEYTVMKHAMVNVPFGPARIWIMRDLIIIPFMAVAVYSVAKLLEGRTLGKIVLNPVFKGRGINFSPRQVITWVLLGLALSAFAVSSTYESYSLENTLHPTQLEIEAVKYIDEHTDGRYVVLSTTTWMSMIGGAFVGGHNPEKYYIYGAFQYPSVAEMIEYIRDHEATVGYFIVPSFRVADFDKVIAEASRNFGLLKVLSNENGEIYIFQYRIPPLPEGYPNPDANVMAFYWDAPPSYMVQNGFARVVFNPAGKNLDVRDFWGDLYESINLNETLVDGRTLRKLTSVEYFESSNGTWINWAANADVLSDQEFRFRLSFESDSLIGVVEKGKPFVQLWWEGTKAFSFSLQAEEFGRLYIPGLVGGEDVYNVGSQQFGLFYTLSRTNDVMLSPAIGSGYGSSLNFSRIVKRCNLTVTTRAFSYDFYVYNDASVDLWANIEVWIPDEIYLGMVPSMLSSVDGGNTWTSGGPIETLGGVDVNWCVSLPRSMGEETNVWKQIRTGAGESCVLPRNFTDSSGGQNRLFFGVYLPAGDEALVRLFVIAYSPLKITYLFRTSDLNNMEENVVKLYDYGTSAYVGGFDSTARPTSLAITEDQTGKIYSVLTTIPPNARFSLLFAEGDTTIDMDPMDGIPDFIQK